MSMMDRYKRPIFSDNPDDFKNKMLELAEDYIISHDLQEEEVRKNNMLFSGIINHIYINLFSKFYLNYADVNILRTIWETYVQLCYLYNKFPSILEYSILTGINTDTMNKWKNSNTRYKLYYDKDGRLIDNISIWQANHKGEHYTSELSTAHSDLHKRMVRECELALRRGASESNKIGSIFLLKALYGYTEIAPIQIDTAKQTALTAAELPKLGNNSGLLSDNSGDNTELE